MRRLMLAVALLVLATPVAAQTEQAKATLAIENESFATVHVYAVSPNGGAQRFVATVSGRSQCVSLDRFPGQSLIFVARRGPVNGELIAMTLDLRTEKSYIWRVQDNTPTYARVTPENLMPNEGATCSVKK